MHTFYQNPFRPCKNVTHVPEFISKLLVVLLDLDAAESARIFSAFTRLQNLNLKNNKVCSTRKILGTLYRNRMLEGGRGLD